MTIRQPHPTRRKFVVSVGLPATLALIGGTLQSAYADSAQPQSIRDCRGRIVRPGPAKRIVCVGGTITETLYDLGAADRIVGIDITSTWPPQALKEKTSVGYMRTLSAEGVLSLQPDLILVMNDAGPPAALQQLVASGTPLIFVDATPSAEAIRTRTLFLAGILDARDAGQRLCRRIDDSFHALAVWRAAHPVSRRVLFVMRMTNGHPMAAGTGTAADAVIRLASALNAGESMQGYKIVDDEALATLHPDIILTMTQEEAHLRSQLLANPGFRLTPAGQRGAVISMEGERLLGFGPRTPEAALDLAHMIEAAAPA
ncbi:ABC transporter substrate-binding protein [Gluconobacter sp. Dm-62]|uniref:heme/hemin ABC transporter substrate-binding protein n=1 Tax=Gluconobacter sp. Dm-62 TaxID=2799804 RepID=UPI001B8D872F|nr:ABC transporter substrate-binding protein [Gluconobacter sp. Dm-62]MBS1101635.1 ABC transporter substrate-binding protein [Gluconobacter sp. Dm-62]